ncbi:hypothetical protein FOA43_003145 [Brettanomyces nanus]|uniref:Plus3 domain-containing protein n=1 Tax=Eeniella nana TaxID=13502 RepID=A0A875S9S1_EENNA|nr:uncharacterized protein FOA43_003145 [Brettanomyces nanus]QPG75784.1 hypothetical protein FOA43_003145 [Brettanomyces nanus]
MSDSDDELMALAGLESDERSNKEDDEYEPQISTSRRSSKRHIEEEEEDDVEADEGEKDPYPLDGKFKDEEDRSKLLSMDEVSREQILYDRMQEKETLRERRYLALRARQSKAESSAMEHTGSKTKKLKTSKLSELKRQREKKNRRRSKGNEDYDEDEENLDDLVEDDDEDDRDLDELAGYGDEDEAYYSDEYEPSAGKTKGSKSGSSWGGYDDKYQREAKLDDLNKKVRFSRTVLDRFMYREEFDNVVSGSYVRLNIGLSRETGKPEYRMAKVEQVKRDRKPYPLYGRACNTYLLVSQGDSKKVIDIACISDFPFTAEEFDNYKKRLENSEVEVPSLGEVEEKFNELRAMSTRKLTDEDINKMVARKQELVGSMDSASRVRRLAGLREELQAALERVELDNVQELTKQIEELTKLKEKTGASTKMSEINLRNKRTTQVLIKRAQRKKAELEKMQSKAVKEDPNDPFSKLALAEAKRQQAEEDEVDRRELDPIETIKATAVGCKYRREGVESVIKDIPFEIELEL